MSELKERRLAQFLVTYCAGGWIVLQGVDQVVDRDVLPEVFYRVVLTLVLCLLPGAVIVSWFHGARGRQRVPLTERWLLGGVGIVALSASGWVAKANTVAANAPTGIEALAPWENPSRVAVLYFDSRGGEDGEFLAAGLTEGLIDELGTVGALHVVSKNGSALYRDSGAQLDSISRGLGVGTLVDGTVSVAGDKLRVDVSLSDGTGEQLYSRRLEYPRTDLFDLQDQLTQEVAVFLRERIGDEVGVIEGRSGTTNLEAWEYFQRAQEAYRDHEELVAHDDVDGASRALSRADSMFARAESLDPEWLAPITQRGWMAYEQSRLGGMDQHHYEEWIAVGLGHAERALAAAPSDPDALELRGTLLYWRLLLNMVHDHAEVDRVRAQVEEDFRDAVAANPRQASALTSLSHFLMNSDRVSEAKLKAVDSYEADPFLRNANLTLWRLYSSSWELEDAVEAGRWCEEGQRRFPDDFRFAQCGVTRYAIEGAAPDIPRAWESQRRWVELAPPQVREFNEKKSLVYMSMALARAGMPDSARAVARRGRASAQVDPTRDLSRMGAAAFAMTGDYDEAVRLFGEFLAANPDQMEAYRHAVPQGDIPWYLADLAENPRFRDLIGVRN